VKRAKPALIFAAALTVLAISAIPASAWFEGVKGTSGAATFGPSTLEANPSTGGNITCTKAEGAWVIESTGKLKEQFEPSTKGQKPTKQGPHQTFWISKWNQCASAGAGGAVPVILSPCVIQIAQPAKGSGTSGVYGSVGTPCKVNIEVEVAKGVVVKCEINFPTEGNETLTPATVSKISGTETQAFSAITNLTSTTSTECASLGISGGKAGKFKGTVTAVGEILV
jgi:hypothetical protein